MENLPLSKNNRMLKEKSGAFPEFFLQQFTTELIKNHSSEELYKLDIILKDLEEKNKINVLKSKRSPELKNSKNYLNFQKEELPKVPVPKELQLESKSRNLKELTKQRGLVPIKSMNSVNYSETNRNVFNLPEHLRYIKPTITEKKVETGKLEPFLRDPNVKTVICNGENIKLIVKGEMGEKQTGVLISKEEIISIIRNFSNATKIPIHEGVFRAAIGRLIITATISSLEPTKFEISKISIY